MKTNLLKFTCGLALLGAALTAPAQGTLPLTLDYSGYFGPTTTLDGIPLGQVTAFSMTATFDADAPVNSINTATGSETFSASTLSFVINSTTYTASSPASFDVWLVDLTAGYRIYAAGLYSTVGSANISSAFQNATPTFQLDSPAPTTFSGSLGGIYNGLHVSLTEGNGDLVIHDGSENVTASLTAVTPTPEPSTLALAGLGGLGMLWRLRRLK